MSRLVIDWQPEGVLVLADLGPEAPPRRVLPRDDGVAGGHLRLEAEHLSRAEVVGVDDVIVWGLAGLAARPIEPRDVTAPIDREPVFDGQGHLSIPGGGEWSAAELLEAFATDLCQELVALVANDRELAAALDEPCRAAIVVVPSLASRAVRDCWHKILESAGFTAAIVWDRREVLAAAPSVVREQGGAVALGDSRGVVLDWRGDGLAGPEARWRAASQERLRAAFEAVLAGNGTASAVRAAVDGEGPGDESEGDRDEARRTHFHRCRVEARLHSDRWFRGRLEAAAIDGAAAETDVGLAAAAAALWARVRNGMLATRLQTPGGIPVELVGFGAGLPGPPSGLEELSPGFGARSAVEGVALRALLLGRVEAPVELPFDCGVLLRCRGSGDFQLGSLLLTRGRRLPARAESRVFEFPAAAVGGLQVGTYGRSFDVVTGAVEYRGRAEDALLTEPDSSGMHRLRFELVADGKAHLEVWAEDLVSGETHRFGARDLRGGQRMTRPPARDLRHHNGSAVAMLLMSYLERTQRGDPLGSLEEFLGRGRAGAATGGDGALRRQVQELCRVAAASEPRWKARVLVVQEALEAGEQDAIRRAARSLVCAVLRHLSVSLARALREYRDSGRAEGPAFDFAVLEHDPGKDLVRRATNLLSECLNATATGDAPESPLDAESRRRVAAVLAAVIAAVPGLW